MVQKLVRAARLAVLSLVLLPSVVLADAISDFYKNKQISILISSTAGSGYDTYARLLSRNLGNYIPGKPSFIPRNMPGAGGMIVANTAYNKGPHDGTLLFTLHFTLPLYQAMGGSGVQFDASKMKIDAMVSPHLTHSSND